MFQYMSFAKPVLVSDATSQKHLIEQAEAGLVHREKSHIDFTDKVMQLFKDDNLQTQFGENGKQFMEEKFSWEMTSKKLITLYDDLKI
ncbi:MAG: glycosyltransferase [Urechidicola sp.]|nr:glycosyltransferase [Urechidicola sp.]